MRIFMSKDQLKIKAGNRIKAVRKALNLGQKEFAEFLGLDDSGQSNISKWERGVQLPSPHYTAILAQKTGRDPVFFSGLDGSDETPVVVRSIELIGEVQAGVWKESASEASGEREYVPLPSFLDVPHHLILKALRVCGDSMDKVYPDGSVVFVAGMFENKIIAQDGDHVVVQRRNDQGEFETTLKEFVVNDDGSKWLWPRSTDPEHQVPLSVSKNREWNSDVVIIAIVQAALTVHKRHRKRRSAP